MTRILIGVLGICLIALGFLGWAYERRGADLTAQTELAARYRQEAETTAQRLAQAISARKDAEAEAARYQQKATEYDDLRKTLEGVGDQELPDWFREYLRRLFDHSR